MPFGLNGLMHFYIIFKNIRNEQSIEKAPPEENHDHDPGR